MVLLLAGEKKYLDMRKKSNIIRFALSLSFVLLSTYIVRPLAPNVAVSILLQALCYIIVIGIVYRMGVYKTLFSISLLVLYFATMENIYIPYVIVYMSKGISSFFANNLVVFLCSIPMRIIQTCVIIFLWKYFIVFVAAKLNKKLYITLTIAITGISLADYFISYIFTCYFSFMVLAHQLIFSIGLLVFAISILFVLKLIYDTTKWAVEGGTRQYQDLENSSERLVEELSYLLENDNITEAKKLLEIQRNKNNR
jgi:hypothetical protein